AEDGIRDFHVTGVQTCALPISGEHTVQCRHADVWTQPGPASHGEHSVLTRSLVPRETRPPRLDYRGPRLPGETGSRLPRDLFSRPVSAQPSPWRTQGVSITARGRSDAKAKGMFRAGPGTAVWRLLTALTVGPACTAGCRLPRAAHRHA